MLEGVEGGWGLGAGQVARTQAWVCFSITTLSSELGSARLSFLCSLTAVNPHSPHMKTRFRDPSTPNRRGIKLSKLLARPTSP